jgi:hypothetical protein
VNLNRLFLAGATVVVAGGLALAFVFLGTPAHQRLELIDAHRVRDLETIASSLQRRYRSGGLPQRLPDDLVVNDPGAKEGYSYRRIDATHYALCATFDTDEPVENGESVIVLSSRNAWRHGAGRTCYKFDVTESPPTPQRV